MVSLNDLKELILYKKQFYLPIELKDKQHGSIITLLTPNFNSSKTMMTAPYIINNRYFESYYVEKEITRFIKNESLIDSENKGEYITEKALDAETRSTISTEDFGIPEIRKYPLNDKKHVLLAIKFFNHVEKKYESELAKNIIKKIMQYNLYENINVGESNRFNYYWKKFKTKSIDEYHIVNSNSVKNMDKKISSNGYIYFNGYELSIIKVKRYIKKDSVDRCFKRISRTPVKAITITVCDDPTVPSQFEKDSCIVYTPEALEESGIKMDYDSYIKYILQLYAIYTLAPNSITKKIQDSIAEPAALYLSGIAEEQMKKKPNKFSIELTFKYIEEKYSLKYLIHLIETNDIDSLLRFNQERKKGVNDPNFNLWYQIANIEYNGSKVLLSNNESELQSIINYNKYQKIEKLNEIGRDTSNDKIVYDEFKFKDLNELTNNDYVLEGNVVYLFEDTNYDSSLRKSLYNDRFKNDKQVLQLYSKVKSELPFIKYTYTTINKYNGKNLFIDLSYYNEAFFRNLHFLGNQKSNKVFNVYMELLERLLEDYNIQDYKLNTIFIPVLDWNNDYSTKMWMYNKNINPISVIYYLMKSKPDILKKIFKNHNVVFLGSKNYFIINFSKTDIRNTLNVSKFTMLIKRMVDLGYDSPADPDPEGELDISPKGIAMSIVDKVEKSQNVEIKDVSRVASLNKSVDIFEKPQNNVDKVSSKLADDKDNVGDDNRSINAVSTDKAKDALVNSIVAAASQSSSIDMALNKLETPEFKEMIFNLQNTSVDNSRINSSQASIVINAQDKFHKNIIKGRSVQEILNSKASSNDIPSTELDIASINNGWKDMTFINFDKDYDFNADIIKMLNSMKNWTYPIAVTNIDIKDNSTSEDIVDLWTIECIDYKKKKFTIRVDVPKFINGSNFMKLRGNEKVLMIQSVLLPIIKTNLSECQIIGSGGYNKIFVRTFGNRKGQSLASANKLMKALNKYSSSHEDMIIETGDNTKICAKYELPIDYIDISRTINSITMNNIKIYFNQDELRSKYTVDDTKGIPIGIYKEFDKIKKKNIENILYYDGTTKNTLCSFISSKLSENSSEFEKCYEKITNNSIKCTYSKASILNREIPVVLICSYLEGLISTMNKGGVSYKFVEKLDRSIKHNDNLDFVEFSDGYLVYEVTYSSSLLMNGLKENDTSSYSIRDINNKKMYIDFLDTFAGNLDVDGLENSYDCMIDPITKEILEKFKMPNDYVSVLIYASNLLADNKYIKHIDQTGRRWRRKELIAGYFYKALTTAYQVYANSNRRTRRDSKLDIKQSAIIDLIVSKDPSTSDLSVNSALNDVECTNSVTNKGLVGMNEVRGYTIKTRGFDESMLNLFGMGTGFSGNVGINRQATINANIEGGRGFLKTIDSNVDKLSAVNSFTITEAITPLGTTHDDPPRTLMTYVQTSKHMMRCNYNDPTLITTGADEAMPYLVSDIFAYKAKKDGKIIEMKQEGFGKNNYMIIEYVDGTHEFVNLSEEVKKNSDGGYHVPMKLDTDMKVGDKFKSGSILAYDKSSFSKSLGESGNLAATIGTLAKIAIINTDEGFEDSAAITESFANRLGTQVIQAIETKIEKGSNIFINKNVGDSVNEGDILFSFQDDFDDDVVNSLLKNLSINNDDISDLGRKSVISKYTGTVSSIAIYRTCNDEDMSDSLKSFVYKYENKIKNYKKIYNKYNIDSSILPQIGKVPEIGKTKHLDDAVLIVYYIKHNDTMSVGDKIVFYSANKGVIKYIIPKEDEPYTEFRPKEHIDSFMSLSSISGRMTCSIPLFAATSKLMVELDRSIKDLAGIPYDESKI